MITTSLKTHLWTFQQFNHNHTALNNDVLHLLEVSFANHLTFRPHQASVLYLPKPV